MLGKFLKVATSDGWWFAVRQSMYKLLSVSLEIILRKTRYWDEFVESG